MDFGEGWFVLSRHFARQMMRLDKTKQVGHVLKFHKWRGNKYACSSCKVLGKMRSVSVVDGRIVGKKHPEDGHHPDCVPVPCGQVDAEQMDRRMRADVRSTGKRPREAYLAAVTSIAEKYKSSSERTSLVANFPSFQNIRASLYRHRKATRAAVPATHNLSPHLRVTLCGNLICIVLKNMATGSE